MVATGASQGPVFQMQAFDRSGTPMTVTAPPGLVVEPMESQNVQTVARQASGTPQTRTANAFCLQYAAAPPQRGMLYRVADSATQQRFSKVSAVLQAAEKIKQAGLLHPDTSNIAAYIESITQWSVWTDLEKWNLPQFAEKFWEHTAKNLRAAGQPVTKNAEEIVRSAAPNRWRDVQQILQAASGGK
jgi:hypothetical protein